MQKSELVRLLRYIGKRALVLILVVIIASYLTILIANAGGYVDEIKKGELKLMIAIRVRENPAYEGLSPSEIENLINELYEQRVKTLGLDRPFIIRSLDYLISALMLDLGRAQYLTSDSGSTSVRMIILERLPVTVLLFTTANMLIFFTSLITGLYLSRRYGKLSDKLIVALSPLSSMPGWFYGVFLIIIFASILKILPYGGIIDAPPPEGLLERAISILRHMILPLSAWMLGYYFIESYSRRTFFLIFSSEDYVEVAKAKGLSDREIQRRYVLRPTLPPILASFALTLIASWQGAIITETIFNWPGLGQLTVAASFLFETAVILGLVVIYAYLLAITVLALDIVYAIVDPRIRVGVA